MVSLFFTYVVGVFLVGIACVFRVVLSEEKETKTKKVVHIIFVVGVWWLASYAELMNGWFLCFVVFDCYVQQCLWFVSL